MIGALQRDVIVDAVKRMYSEVARSPERGFHFPTGRSACDYVGYPVDDLDTLPARTLASFAGVACPFAAGVIRPGRWSSTSAAARARTC
ncbi:MAG TPA: hypothetical protein VFQ22_10015 [Longimicrobiales bacterium]|nr:hypothetical protein [Longimicrobiales bacterium]